jgi:hypothetical protein
MREVAVITFVGFVFSALHHLERPRHPVCRARRAG